MFMDFICVALDQIVNQAAKLKYMFGGERHAAADDHHRRRRRPVRRSAAQPDRSKRVLCHIPGLKVVYAVEPGGHEGPDGRVHRRGQPDGDDQAQASARHERRGAEEDPYDDPARGGQRRCGRASDVTVVAWARMANEALAAAEQLAADGHRLRGDRPAHAAAVRHGHRRRIGPPDQPRRRRPRGSPLRWARCRDRRADPGGRRSTTSTRRSGGSARRSRPVPFSPVLEKYYVPDAAAHRRRHPRRGRTVRCSPADDPACPSSGSSSTRWPARTCAGS